MTANDRVGTVSVKFPKLGNKPVMLYYRGCFRTEMLKSCVTVVGSRKMTEYGRHVIRKMVPSLVQAGKIIISGMMYGVDQTVHKECLECGGTTIAVLGWGLDWDRKGEAEKNLEDKIIESGGVVMSEWKDSGSALWMFPHRDRIMAAMATEIYVVEGAMKSGSMITAHWARKLEKPIWAVPGPVTSRVSTGTNWLIASGQAQMWLPSQQLDLGVGHREQRQSQTNIGIYKLLENEPLTIDEMAVKLSQPVGELGASLSMMLLSGEICERDGKYYIVE